MSRDSSVRLGQPTVVSQPQDTHASNLKLGRRLTSCFFVTTGLKLGLATVEDLSLAKNPFAVLRVSPRAKIDEIEDAFEDAVVDRPADEQFLLKIKQLLLTPNARLIAELSWLSEVAPRRADQIVGMLERGDVPGLLHAMPGLPPLSSANLAAEAAARIRDARFIPLLIGAHARISREATLSWLNSTRATAGFARVEGLQIDDALRSLRTAHARSALAGIVAQPSPAYALGALLGPGTDPHDPMIKEIFREYDHWSSPHLGEIERDINAALADLMAVHEGALDRVIELLKAWDELSEPAQLYCQLSGLDEERSLRIYRLVRGHCIDLANNHQRFDDAHAIATVMRDLFKELPTAASELKDDIDTLARLSIEQRIAQAIAPLQTALNDARANVGQLITELKSTGFTDQSGALVAPLHRALVQTSHVLSASEHADLPIKLVRSLALDLNNEHDDPTAAVALLSGLRQLKAPVDPEIAAQIKTDILITENNRDHRLLSKAIDRKNHGEAIRIVDLMVARTPAGDDAVHLRALQTRLKQQRNKQYFKWGGWAAAGAFILYLITRGGGSSSPPPIYTTDPSQAATNGPSTPSTPAPTTVDPTASPPVENAPATAPTTSSTDETPPPIGTSLELDASQVRYCTFEKARLTALKDLVSESNQKAIDSFNVRVDDYNSRCSSFRYHSEDLDAANAVVASDADRFTSEARTIAEGWN